MKKNSYRTSYTDSHTNFHTEELTIEKVLQLPALHNAKLIAGKKGITKVITNAMVLEATDIEKWGRPGLLLFTSFFAFSHLSQDEQIAFLQKMADMQMSGIVFKAQRLVKMLPEYFLKTCDRLAIPVIAMDPNTVYETLLTEIIGEILHTNNRVLNEFFDVHRQTMRLALEQPSDFLILTQLKKLIRSDVTLFSPTTEMRVGTNNTLTNFSDATFSALSKNSFQTFDYYKALLSYDDAADHRGDDAAADPRSDDAAADHRSDLALVIPSITHEKPYLIIHREFDDVSNLDIVAIENYASLLMMSYLKQAELDIKLYLKNNSTIYDLLLGRFNTKEAIDLALRSLHIDSHPYYQVMLLRVAIDDPQESHRLPDILNSFKIRLHSKYFNLVVFDSNNRTVFLRNFASQATKFSIKTIEKILNELNESPNLPTFHYLLAISSTADRYAIAAINNEVFSIYKLFDSQRDKNLTIEYSELGVLKLLLNIKNLQELPQYIDSRIKVLLKEHEELFTMLVSVCEHNLNLSQAAAELYVHPKTVSYRLERLQQNYGIDVHNADDRLQIMLASKILKLFGAQNSYEFS